jgi:SAM-dependent methyltransferase
MKASGHDLSKPKRQTYPHVKQFYRSAEVAREYDERRFGRRSRRRSSARKWRRIVAALETASDVKTILDVPCGTGRFIGQLLDRGYVVVGCDISHQMMKQAEGKFGVRDGAGGYIQAEAEALPLADASIDCVLCIRFMFHVDGATRVKILREMGRVSRRWLIIDYRHRYSVRYLRWRTLRRLGLARRSMERVSRAQLEQEFRDAGLRVHRVIPVTRVFSDKWIVVGESRNLS